MTSDEARRWIAAKAGKKFQDFRDLDDFMKGVNKAREANESKNDGRAGSMNKRIDEYMDDAKPTVEDNKVEDVMKLNEIKDVSEQLAEMKDSKYSSSSIKQVKEYLNELSGNLTQADLAELGTKREIIAEGGEEFYEAVQDKMAEIRSLEEEAIDMIESETSLSKLEDMDLGRGDTARSREALAQRIKELGG